MADPYAMHRARRERDRALQAFQKQRSTGHVDVPRFRQAGSILESETDFDGETVSNIDSSFSYGSSTASSFGPSGTTAGSTAYPDKRGIRQPIPQRLASYDLPGFQPLPQARSNQSGADALRQRNIATRLDPRSAASSVDQFYPKKSDLLHPPSILTGKSTKHRSAHAERTSHGGSDSKDGARSKSRNLRKESTLDSKRYDSPLRRYARYMARFDRSSRSSGTVTSVSLGMGARAHSLERFGRDNLGLVIGLIGVVGLKWLVGHGGYSGEATPPLFGDFEAQRHWMELTANLPLQEWYGHGEEWWQLDYPPVTAYVSWIFGKIGLLLDPPSFQLLTSRGIESPFLKLYMRSTVLVLELVSWLPIVVAYIWYNQAHRSRRTRLISIMTVILWPGLVLIDNGHFQYNSFMLALSLLSVLCFQSGHDVYGCIAFSLSLGFKQMALYYSPVVFGYLVGKCIWLGGREGIIHLRKIAVTTSLTFLAIFGPFLTPFPNMPLLVLHRMFPLGRGIFEDKVANFWCASNVGFKWRRYFAPPAMAKLATVMTLAAFIPTLILIIYSSFKLRSRRQSGALVPTTTALLPTAMLSTSLSFFLFSFQVHEKSILVPMMWAVVIMALERGGGDSVDRTKRRASADRQAESDKIWYLGALLLNVANFSMFPLLKKDGQVLQYFVMQGLWSYVIGYNPSDCNDGTLSWTCLAIHAFMIVHHALEYTVVAPARYPDIFPVMNVLLSTAVFGLAWLWSNKRLLDIALRLEVFDMGMDIAR